LDNKVVAIVQARMGSTRLPGKVLKDLKGKPVLEHLIERLRQSSLIAELVIATTESAADDQIVQLVRNCGVRYYRGSENDVLARYYYAAKEIKADTVVRITSDCPLIDPFIIDDMIRFYQENDYSIVTNGGNDLEQRTFPRGLDVEVFSFQGLERAFRNAPEKYQREHVTPYIYENAESVYYFKNGTDYSNHRWTLDTEEDYELLRELYRILYKGKHDFYFKDILKVFEQFPDLVKINRHVEQKKLM